MAVASVGFFVGATLVGTDTTSPYSISWDSTTVADGTVSITARATDTSTNATTSAARSVTVTNAVPDTTPPTVSLTAPASGATVSGSSVTISATASDDVAVASVGFFVGATLVGTDTTSPYSISWDSTTVADGTASITARATDTSTNATTSRGPQRDGRRMRARHDPADREPDGAGQRRHGQRLERHDQRHRQR